MSWMHDRVSAASVSRSRRRHAQAGGSDPFNLRGGIPGLAGADAPEGVQDHVGIPRIIGRRARWVTSRLSRRA
ncbi:hypothetical protein [Phaeacidiphilus oryzae]|uniref:hypothetical protein n=1 Tax=Phaeacidiphilus oryzae TaxID=348818 RepID=UPI00056A4619|nr:hypothetical protein [Phaeacidiphilus oryzae]